MYKVYTRMVLENEHYTLKDVPKTWRRMVERELKEKKEKQLPRKT